MKSELNSAPMFFLGANSPKGFISRFHESFRYGDGWHTYIIKGGPGTGKSTLMKRIADYFLRKGARVYLCPCSSDPNSLDGVIFPDMKIVLLDGTAPHIVEPKYPGAVEEIVNLGDCWNTEDLKSRGEEIMRLTDENSRCHGRARNYLAAAGLMLGDIRDCADQCCNREKAEKFGLSLCRRMIPKTKAKGTQWCRYLSALTPNGHIFYKSTLEKLCEQIVVISDDFGAASSHMLSTIRDYALSAGHEIITCLCPLSENLKYEHIIIPALKLGFATSNRYHKLTGDTRIIHARRFTDMKALHLHRDRLNFNRRAATEMLSLATDSLMDAKAIHDALEKCYIDCMDFERLNKVTESLAVKIANAK